MDLYHLRTFVAVIDCGSISGAARRLARTPSSVSSHVKALEHEFQVELFERTSRGVSLTHAGARLETYARKTLQAADDFAVQAASRRQAVAGKMKLALSVSDALFDLPAFALKMRKRYPAIGLKFARSETARILDGIIKDELDIGIVYGQSDDPELRAHRLGHAQLVVCIPAHWADKIDTSWNALGDLPWINTGDYCPFQDLLDNMFLTHNIQPPQYIRSDDERTRLQLVCGGLGISLLEQSEAKHPDVLAPDLTPVCCSISLVYRARRQHEPMIRAVREMITSLSH
ncbi:MAG: LysR family transcriptional regulator [Chloroflexi bacterium]|nr:LysR family transcriptional regulator [Chloroflexota bacterium]